MTAVNLNRAIRGPVTAVPVVAGKGVRLVADTENNRWVVEADETVLWSGFKSDIPSTGISAYTLSELATNFETVRIEYVLQDNSTPASNTGNKGVGTVFYEMSNEFSRSVTYIHCVMNGSSSDTNFNLYDIDTNISNMDTLIWNVKSVLRGQTNNGVWFHITKIVGIHRIASN